jgi:iron complex transport system substrate-binding protein
MSEYLPATQSLHVLSLSPDVWLHLQVREAMESGKVDLLYQIDAERLRELQPDVILSQGLCSVCSIDVQTVERVCKKMVPEPTIVNVSPENLDGVLASVLQIGKAVGMEAEAAEVESKLRARVRRAVERAGRAAATRKQATGNEAPNVAFVEWLDPIYVGGHWTPELIAMAGARHPLNPPGSGPDGKGGGKSFAVSASAVSSSDPDFVILCPCGLDLKATETEAWRLWDAGGGDDAASGASHPKASAGGWFKNLRAVKEGRVAMVDGNQMFNRPGPRLVDTLEWLVEFVQLGAGCLGALGGGGSATQPPDGFPWKLLHLAKDKRPDWLPQKPDQCCSAPAAPAPGAPALSAYAAPVGGFSQDIEDCHKSAMEAGHDTYTDPQTGYMVGLRCTVHVYGVRFRDDE